MNVATDTIAAIATAPGEAGIGIVRASGPEALSLALAMFRRADGSAAPQPLEARPESHHDLQLAADGRSRVAAPGTIDSGSSPSQLLISSVPGSVSVSRDFSAALPASHRAYYGYVVRPGTEDKLDECLFTYFAGPRSYTGEDVVEIACHGSNLVLAAVLNGLVARGARIADPGEFTRRAYLNGRMDLAEAEAVIDVIRARTDAALRVATGQLSGRLSREIAALRHALITLLAEIEAAIDFPDDVEPPPDAEVATRAEGVREAAARLLATADAGRLYREGAAIVLVGRPNVGKSSLLNALLGEARAIVTDVPGTTRDVIEESVNLRGIPVRAIDTAGLRDTTDTVESLGVARTRAQLESADLVLWVLDASEGVTDEDLAIARELAGRRVLPVGNKVDRGWRIHSSPSEALPVPIAVSALSGEGVQALRDAVAERLIGGAIAPESIWVSNSRHQARLLTAIDSLDRAIEAARLGFDQAAISLDLKLAAEAMGEITGETVTEETISQIFARFCVGK